MITVFCNRLGWFNLEILVSQFQSRLMFGVQRQLLDLIRISLLNSQRARLFYTAGHTTVASIAMCDIKKIEKILRSSMTFVANKKPETDQVNNNNSEVVIWSDGKGYTYWEASELILREANQILGKDLEALGVKVKTEKAEGLNKTANKTLFEFNDTIDSILQSQDSKRKSAEVFKQPEPVKIETPEKVVEVLKAEPEAKINPPSVEPSKEELEISLQNLTIDEKNVSQVEPEAKLAKVEASQASSSFIDDQFMLQAAETFEKGKNIPAKIENKTLDSAKKVSFITPNRKEENAGSARKETRFCSVLKESGTKKENTTPARKELNLDSAKKEASSSARKETSSTRKCLLNTTVVSDDVLQMCDIFEKNVLSNKKSNQNKENNPPETATSKKKLNYALGDETLKNIFDSTNLSQNCDKDLIEMNLDVASNSAESLNIIKSLERLTNPLSLKVNISQTLDQYEAFYSSIKPKQTFSLSLVCELASESDSSAYFKHVDSSRTNGSIKFYGLFVCLDSDKQKEVNFMLFRNNMLFLDYLKKLLERDDLIKVLFYSKNHYKLLKKAFNVSIRTPCYDPIIANWILNQELSTIFHIKQKYCPSLNILIDSELKKSKGCFGCSLNPKIHLSNYEAIQKGFVEAIIGIYAFEKIKPQLQINNLWIYYAKIESEIVLVTAEIELMGFGLNSSELESQKSILLRKKKEIEDKISVIAGKDINLNSPDEVAWVVYDKLKLKPLKEESKPGIHYNSHKEFKHHSTSKDVLQQLASQHDFPKLIILWRKINHTISNSINPIDRVSILNFVGNFVYLIFFSFFSN